MLLALGLIVLFVVLLLVCGATLSKINSATALREQHMSAAMFVAGTTMAVYLHFNGYPLSLIWLFAAGLALPWLLYRLIMRRPNQMMLWDKVDWNVHVGCLAVAVLSAAFATQLLPITPQQVGAMGFSYLIAWLLLFPL